MLGNEKRGLSFKNIKQKAGSKAYFINPYSSLQRGTNKNTNELLR